MNLERQKRVFTLTPIIRPPIAAWLTLSVALALLPGADVGHAATDPDTGLEVAAGWEAVRAHCSACHSLRLVTQNRGDAEHWRGLIRWMQRDHNLWDLGEAENEIVAYLAEHYGQPALSPRRAPLNTAWQQR